MNKLSEEASLNFAIIFIILRFVNERKINKINFGENFRRILYKKFSIEKGKSEINLVAQ